MANRTFSLRLPAELLEAIEEHARVSGKTKTDLVIEALLQVYDVPQPATKPITLDAVQHQVNALRDRLDTFHELRGTLYELRENAVGLTSLLRQTRQSLDNVKLLPMSERNGSTALPSSAEDATSSTSKAIASTPPDANGAIVPLLDVAAIDDPVQLAIQLRYQMQIFDQIFSAIPELVFICDRVGHFTYVSPVGARVWGIDRAELLGQLYYDVKLPPEFLEFHLSQFETALSFGKVSSAELSVASTNTAHYYEYTLSPIQDDSGSVIGAVGIALDITQRKRDELALQESYERYRNLFELANDMIFIIDGETHQIIDANLKASRRLRYTRRELYQMTFEEIETPESAQYFQSVIVPRLEKLGSAIFTHTLRRKDGDAIAVEISIRLIEHGDRLAYQGFARDMSERNNIPEIAP
ncbi:MAG: PAS domain-containing protein [Synechococcales bacterium]|nr:PAS domain-containing protein [Synechococcales bacterium]